ncbi:hypothetical protein ACW6U8_08470 [Bacillus subtilis]|uniref:hypothetical protein n=1 Tax=Bacillus subtilis TaxID=1423 RepID=UPI00201D2215|nr:hypothetical protein [Bacillus subtilis]UQZ53264.1 hypothetical protein C2H96_01550 [Bacillus subtilis]UQZ68357.1 hypothetical protein C2H97_18715 [Bacillus subtilis PY79]UQZ72763.1 hypothetical protein C2I05_20680 [Bacillus subtilis]
MKQVYKYDENFMFIEPVLVYEKDGAGNYVIPGFCTEIEPPATPSLFIPKFDPVLRGWIEGATKAEIDEILNHAQSVEDQSPIEVLKAQNAAIMVQLAESQNQAETQAKMIADLLMMLAEGGEA